MRLAVFNVENLFDRAKALNQDSWDDGRDVLDKFADLNELLGERNYTAARKRKMVELMIELGLESSDTGPFVLLRRNRGNLLRRPRGGGLEIIASGRIDWSGSLELRDEPIDDSAMRNTARVLLDINADVVGLVEAESRPVLDKFNREIISSLGDTPYGRSMLIDGNDSRGIDVGLLSGDEYPVISMVSHVDDRDRSGKRIFSRDCPEFLIQTAAGYELLVMVNHLKSKGYGGTAASNRRRKAQAKRIAEIYEQRIAEGYPYVAVLGDLNDTPNSNPLKPLIQETNLTDVFEHPDFDDGGYPGTYGYCNAGDKIDYVLLSPDLFDLVESGFVMREGMWPGVRPRRWDCYAEITKKSEVASDHAAICVDIDL